MSQNTTSSVRDLLPDNCFLNLEDDDNDTLDLVTDVNYSYYPSTNIDPVTVNLMTLILKMPGILTVIQQLPKVGQFLTGGRIFSYLKIYQSFSRRDVAASRLKVRQICSIL